MNMSVKFHQNRLKTVASRPELTDMRRKNKFPISSNRSLRSLSQLLSNFAFVIPEFYILEKIYKGLNVDIVGLNIREKLGWEGKWKV